MARYQRWIFEANATKDAFVRHMTVALTARGFAVGPGRVFDVAVTGSGARGWVKVFHHPQGLDVVLKQKGARGVTALETAVLEAGREAQAKILKGEDAA